jgi:hypothetical protein
VWHRIIERNRRIFPDGFTIISDFIVMTNNNVLVLVEAKGDYLAGETVS